MLKPGQILLFEMDGLNIWERIITSMLGDCDICHSALVGPIINEKQMIYTTGAKGMFYGLVEAEKYLSTRTCFVVEGPWEQFDQIVDNAHHFMGQRYGIEKVLYLKMKSLKGGVVSQLYPWHTGLNVKHPFCSESVSWCFWKAGIEICRNMDKEEPSAITPLNLYNYALMKETPFNIIGRTVKGVWEEV